MKQLTFTKKLVSVLFCILSDLVYAFLPADVLHLPVNCDINVVSQWIYFVYLASI